jgi:endonuclease YncB( thermonuclease family)
LKFANLASRDFLGESIMKWLSFLLLTLLLAGCLPTVEIVPPETLAAQTMAAMPKTVTPGPTNTPLPPPTATPDTRPPTPMIDLTLPGAYCLPTNTTRNTGLVTKVLDGSTIEVATNNQTWIVRYIGLDAPSIVAPMEWQAPQSLGLNESLVNGRNVTLIQDVSVTDALGYYPRYVIVDNTFVNYEVVRQGMASAVAIQPDVACQNALLAAQVEAQAAVSGIWQPTPLPTFTLAPSATITNTPGPATATSVPPCSCRQYTCNAFPTQARAQACYDYCRRNGLGLVLPDQNNNGRVCEGLP